MAIYNMQKGDVPILKSPADKYTMSDNFHQSFMGSTGANHFTLGISWAYYGGAYNAAVALTNDPTSTDPTVQIGKAYCNICNFESRSVPVSARSRKWRERARTKRIRDKTVKTKQSIEQDR